MLTANSDWLDELQTPDLEVRGSSLSAADFPTDVVAARWDSTPAVKSAVTTDVWLVRGGLRHPVSLVADEIPPQCIPL